MWLWDLVEGRVSILIVATGLRMARRNVLIGVTGSVATIKIKEIVDSLKTDHEVPFAATKNKCR